MLTAAGFPLLWHALFFLKQRGVRRAVCNLHYLGDQIEAGVARVKGMRIATSHEAEILGTAGGIRNALELIPDDYVLIVNPDAILWPLLSYPLDELVAVLGAGDALLFVAPRRPGETGLNLDKDGHLQFGSGGREYYIGCSLMKKSAFVDLPQGERAELGTLWRRMAENRSLRGLAFTGDIVDLGTAESYMRNRDVVVPSHLMRPWQAFVEECR